MTKRVGLWLLCVLLLGGIAAEGVMLHRRTAAPVPEAPAPAETEPVRTPEDELTDLLRSGDYDTAAALLAADFADAPLPAQAAALLSEQAEAACAAYTAGETDANTAESLLRRILTLNIDIVDAKIRLMLEELRLHEAALSWQRAAAAYAAAGDYPNAIAQYDRIPKRERALYDDAQAQIAVCTAQYRESTLSAAEEALRSGDSDTAESLLRTALQLLPEDTALQALSAQIEEQRQSAAIHEAMQRARRSFDAQEYAEAAAVLQTLPDTEEARHIAAGYRAMYLLRLQTDTMLLLRQGDTDAAEALIAEGEQLYPDAAEPAALRTELQAWLPVALSALEAGEFSDFAQAESPMKDSRGTEYSAESGNLYCSYDGTMTGRQRSTAAFRTGGEYAKLALTAVPAEGFADGTVLLELRGDGKQLGAYTITRETGALQITADISGVQTLQIRVLPIGSDDLRNAGVIIADGNVRK